MIHPLIIGYLVVVADIAVWRFRLPKHEVGRLITRLLLFAALSYVLFDSGLSPFGEAPGYGSMPLHIAGQVLEVIWWLNGARLLSQALDTLLLPRAWRRQRLFQDVFGALVFLAATVAALGFVLQLPIRGLVATSGALAIVLGLAIQSTLSDVFAGIVLNTTEPYQVGDWVVVDGVDGRVVEMNWRATHLLTSQGNVVIVPNAVAAKTKITNNSRPGKLHGVIVGLEISPQERPATVIAALERAVAGVTAVMSDPAPYVSAKKSTVNSVLYEVTAYVDDIGKKTPVGNELFDLCYRHLAAAGIELRPLGVSAVPPMLADPREALLRRVDLFSALTREDLQNLAPLLVRREYQIGEVVIGLNSVPDSLTIIESGSVTIVADDASGSVEVARLGPGDTLGEAGLLAGKPARVQVSALTRVAVYRLRKDDLTPVLKRAPDVAKLMCEQLSKRQDRLSKLSAEAPVTQSEQSVFQWLLDGMRKLHDLRF